MTNSEQIASLAVEVAALKARVDKSTPENAPEPDLRSRLTAEREQRKAALDAKKFANPRRGVSVTSDLRQEQIVRTNTRLATPIIQRPVVPAPAPAPAAGTSSEFYCWKEGVLGTIKIQTGGVFTPI